MLDLTLEEFKEFSSLIDDDIYKVLSPKAVVNARDVAGGTARNRVEEQIEKAAGLFKSSDEWIEKHAKQISVLIAE